MPGSSEHGHVDEVGQRHAAVFGATRAARVCIGGFSKAGAPAAVQRAVVAGRPATAPRS